MRQIKFRGKRKDNGEWVEGYYVQARNNGRHFIIKQIDAIDTCNVGMQIYYLYEVDPASVRQFTGLLDKNGLTDVYEYDIIGSDGLLKGNQYDDPGLLKDKTNFLVQGFGTSAWRTTEEKAMGLGCKYAK